jgi:predicted GIY-YIG superfamily endonuclease
MKRRTYLNLKARVAKRGDGFHHHVYVVLLSPEAASHPKILKTNPNRDPAKPCVYVGMTGLKPHERLQNHKKGIKAARVVQRYGLKLLPELFECFNPMPFEAAAQMERDLAEDLRKQGYTVTGGN